MTLAISGTTGITLATQFDSASTFGFKNRIINGGMVIDQRNAGAVLTPINSQYTLDRWQAVVTQASKFTVQQGSGSSPVNFSNYLTVVSSSAYSVLSGDAFDIQQPIEGFNVADLGWGTANAKTVTLSFQVISSLTGTFGGAITNSAANRSYPFSYSVPTANTWTTISVTIAGDTSGTWLTTSGIGLVVRFGLGSGSTFSGTSGAWAAGNLIQPTGTVSVVGTNTANWAVTGVQLEQGSTATTFDFRSYGTELALCQRYLPAITGNSNSLFGFFYSTTNAYVGCTFPVTARVAPTGATFSSAGHFTIADVVSSSIAATSASFSSAGDLTGQLIFVASGLTAQRAGLVISNSSSAKILFTGCEL